MEKPDFFTLKNGSRSKLPFSNKEYENRLTMIRAIMNKNINNLLILLTFPFIFSLTLPKI